MLSSPVPDCFTPITKKTTPSDYDDRIACSGYCTQCGTTHQLPVGPALRHCHELMTNLERFQRIDFDSAVNNPQLSTDYLYGPARGQMFGILVCRHNSGTTGFIKAFSGQYDGIWQVQGWVPPLFDVMKMNSLCENVEKNIKKLGRAIAAHSHDSPLRPQLITDRRQMSQNLMRKIHSLYVLQNFKGRTASLTDVFMGTGKGIPTGTADCCAPKLLGYAARHGLTPIGLAEFFWGRENKSQTKLHKTFYPACSKKCQPILGYMLCGTDQ